MNKANEELESKIASLQCSDEIKKELRELLFSDLSECVKVMGLAVIIAKVVSKSYKRKNQKKWKQS